MRKLITAVVLAVVASSSFAQHHGVRDIRTGTYQGGQYSQHNHSRHGYWIAPLIIGGVVGAVIANQNQPVIVQQAPVYQQPIQPIYKSVEIFIPECNCFRVVTVQIN